ncbi:MAG: LysR family transcriptional regulator [Lachnospiraceae bacterium]|nr:LysR family transcriptional regulator [Lachnospiraceae bacterium]
MDDRKIQVFLAVVEHGSFSKASEHLHCTQSAVTQTINRLENELGCTLLNRYHSGVKLTSAGEQLFPDLQAAFNGLENLRTHAERISTAMHSQIRIGSFSSIANTWLPEILKEYREQHSETVFTIKICTNDIEEQLKADQIDIAFGDRSRLSHSLFIPLMEDPYFAVVPEGIQIENTVVTQQELSELPFLMAPMNDLEEILSVHPWNAVRVDSDDDGTLLTMVANGLGSTVMPQLSLTAVPKGVRVLPLEPGIHRTLGIGMNAEPAVQTRRFCDFVKASNLTKQ